MSERVISVNVSGWREGLESYLGIVKVKDDANDSRKAKEDQVVFPPNGRKSSGRNLQENNRGNKESRNRHGKALCSKRSWKDFRRIDVGRGIGCRREADHVPEEKEDGRSSHAVGFCALKDADANAFADESGDDAGETNDQETSTADTIDEDGVDGVSKGADADPAALDEELADGGESEGFVQLWAIV